MALGIDDVKVGMWTAASGRSGCTVILPPTGTIGAMAVRGAAPGTREAAALSPSGKVDGLRTGGGRRGHASTRG
jgi:L-aminopeptidase/D-esterase-like protein